MTSGCGVCLPHILNTPRSYPIALRRVLYDLMTRHIYIYIYIFRKTARSFRGFGTLSGAGTQIHMKFVTTPPHDERHHSPDQSPHHEARTAAFTSDCRCSRSARNAPSSSTLFFFSSSFSSFARSNAFSNSFLFLSSFFLCLSSSSNLSFNVWKLEAAPGALEPDDPDLAGRFMAAETSRGDMI